MQRTTRYSLKLSIDEFQTLLTYARKLTFEEEPNYKYISDLLKDICTRNTFKFDFVFDWSMEKNNQLKSTGEQSPEEFANNQK